MHRVRVSVRCDFACAIWRSMKKRLLLGVLIPLAVAASGLGLIACHSKVQSQPWERSGIPEADWKDAKSWRSTSKYKAVVDELKAIAIDAEARGGPTAEEAEVLINYMNSPHYDVRETAVIAAETATSDPARSVLIPHVLGLLSDPVWTVRGWAAKSLGEMGDKSVIPYLEPLLKDRPVVAKVAQKAILKLQGEQTVPGK